MMVLDESQRITTAIIIHPEGEHECMYQFVTEIHLIVVRNFD